MNPKRTFLAVFAAVALAAVGMYPVILTDWFSQTFAGLEDGEPFTGQGVSGGSWDAIPAGAATVATVNGRKCISIDTTFSSNEVRFVASSAPEQTVRRIDFAVASEPTPWLPAALGGDKGALSLADSGNGVLTFVGYTKDGWVKMSCQGLVQRKAEWIHCRAEFEYVSATEAYVTYYACCGGRGYQPLADTAGDTRFPADAASKIDSVAFYGTGAAGDFVGFGVEQDLSRVFVWKGSSGAEWNDPANWQEGKVPGNGDLAQVPSGKSITFGKYKLTAWAASEFAIVSNECLRISTGNLAIACTDTDDRDHTSLGTVYVEAGATLQASGRYRGIETAAGSTLSLEAANGSLVVEEPFFLDGVNLELDVAGVSDGIVLVLAPYGSGGVPASQSLPSGWSVAWHGRLDGTTALWLAYREDETDIAIWRRDGVPGNLVDTSNWSKKPGSGVAARMEDGQAHVNRGDVFEFTKRFDIGYAGSGEVDMSDGSVFGRSDAAAVVVGANGGTGLLDVVGGIVRPYDCLWNYALTLGSGTNSAGTVTVRGGTVDASGGSVSVGADGAANMAIEKGSVAVGDSMGVGYSGALAMSGGQLSVSNSIYIGRAARGEAYDVKMTVSNGAVSNLAAGAIWVGSYGGVGSKAVLELTGGEVYATNSFVCGGYRSAQVYVNGGKLVAPEICVGYDLIDEEDIASFNLVSGCIETVGFTSGTNGVREVTLVGGELVATMTNEDFFAGIEAVRLEGDAVLSNAGNIAVRSAFVGPGDFIKAGVGTNAVAGYAAWAGKTVVREGVLDMRGGMIMGELVLESAGAVINAKYDEMDELLPFMSAEAWTSGTPTTRPFVRLEFKMAADGQLSAVAADGIGMTKGALASSIDAETGARTFLGWTALGWAELGFRDGSAVGAGEYDLRMAFDFRAGKPYVAYSVKRGTAWERLVSSDGLDIFPVAGAASIETFSGVEAYAGTQLYVADGKAFYWIGPAGGEWNDGNNWSYAPGGEAAGKYPNATGSSGSLAFVERPAGISIGTAAKTALLMVNDSVRVFGAKALNVSSAISGAGCLMLSNATLQAAGEGVPVNVPVIAADGTANRFLSTPSTCTFVLNGSLRGTGEIALTASNRRPMGGTVLAGDNSAFCGILKFYPFWSESAYQKFDMPSIASPLASSAAAQWEINVEHDYSALYPGVDFFGQANATYRFGSLKANFCVGEELADNAYWAKDGVTLEVGALDLDGYALGACVAKGGVIDWVAPTATFWNGVTGLSALRLSGGGKMVVDGEDALPSDAITFADMGGELLYDANADLSVLITNSTAPVVFNDCGGYSEWSGAPGPSNVGGFVKRGSGTLVWYAVPSFRIDVTVEEGVLVVPFGAQLGRLSVARGAEIHVVCSNAVENALVFSADASNVRRMAEPYLRFLDVPADYEITMTYGNDNAIVAANGGDRFSWTDATEDQLWSTPGNWLVGESVPARGPQGLDRVDYDSDISTTRLDRASAAMTLDGAGDLSFTGSFALDALLRFKLSGALELWPEPMSADEASPDYYGAGTNVLGVSAAAEFSSRTVRGEGFVSAGDKDLVVAPSGGETDCFVGTLQAADFVKRGDGAFVLVGDGAFSGKISVEQGTLRLGSYRDIDGIRMDFDASDADSLECEDTGVVRWSSRVGTNVFAYAAGQYAVTGTCFGVRSAVMLRPDASSEPSFSRYDLYPANAPGVVSKSLFLVYKPVALSSGSYGYAQSGSESRGLRLEGDVFTADYRWYCPESGFGTLGVFSGVSYGSASVRVGEPALAFWSDTALQDEQGVVESLGTSGTLGGFCGAVGEVVAFARTLTHVERDVISRLLMNKWGVSGCGEFAPVHAATPVAMCAGATLDLGGQTVNVGSFTGAGIVTNGVLKTADGKIVQSGGMLVVPAYEGTTYVASNAGEKLIIRDAPGVKIRIVIPKGWFTAGNTGRRVIFCESELIDWDIWNDKVRPVSEGDGWWSVSGGGFAIRLR